MRFPDSITWIINLINFGPRIFDNKGLFFKLHAAQFHKHGSISPNDDKTGYSSDFIKFSLKHNGTLHICGGNGGRDPRRITQFIEIFLTSGNTDFKTDGLRICLSVLISSMPS